MSKEYELRVVNKTDFYVELVALLNCLISDRTSEGILLSPQQNEFLNLLQGLRLKGLELFEFRLLQENMDDIAAIEKLLMSLNKIDFLYFFFGEELTKEEIKQAVEQQDVFDQIAKRNKYLGSYSHESLNFLLNRTEEFIQSLFDVFKLINKKILGQLSHHDVYMESIQKVSKELRAKVPLEVAQNVMGKRFKRISDYSTYYFVPSFFYANRPMRTFNTQTQLVVYPVRKAENYSRAALANVLRIIGDDTRLEIIKRLSQRPMYGKELANELGLVNSTVSHHLEQLRSIGLLYEEREKSVKYFSLNYNEYARLCDAMKSFIISQ